MKINLEQYAETLKWLSPVDINGTVTEVTGLLIKASIPHASLGEVCEIRSSRGGAVKAEVVGFLNNEVVLMPLGEMHDIAMGAEVISTATSLSVNVSDELLGRVLNGLGEPVDGLGQLTDFEQATVDAKPPHALTRRRITNIFPTGIKAIDGCLTTGEGQRVGIFSAAGVGKSTLLGMLARSSDADINVIALVGERGREVRDFLERDLGSEGLKRSVVVYATSNEPSLVRLRAAHVATAIAEYFRDRGKRVLFLMDSVTRFARALREVGLARGEPPARAGFPPSVFRELPRLLERTGNSSRGSITGFYSVLVEGDDLTEPVADETRSILDGHIVLSRSLSASGIYPAIDINNSISRVMPSLIDATHLRAAEKLRSVLSVYEAQKDLIMIGAYKKGSDPETDYSIEKLGSVRSFLMQDSNESVPFEKVRQGLEALF